MYTNLVFICLPCIMPMDDSCRINTIAAANTCRSACRQRLSPASGLPLPTPLRMPSSIAGCDAACMRHAAPPGDAASAAGSSMGAACLQRQKMSWGDTEAYEACTIAEKTPAKHTSGAPSARLPCWACCTAAELAAVLHPLLLRRQWPLVCLMAPPAMQQSSGCWSKGRNMLRRMQKSLTQAPGMEDEHTAPWATH